MKRSGYFCRGHCGDYLIKALDGIDVVFSNLGPYRMMGFALPLVAAMKRHDTRHFLWTATGGSYDEFPKGTAVSDLHDQRKAPISWSAADWTPRSSDGTG